MIYPLLMTQKEPPLPMIGDHYTNSKGECFVYKVHGWEFVGLIENKRGVK